LFNKNRCKEKNFLKSSFHACIYQNLILFLFPLKIHPICLIQNLIESAQSLNNFPHTSLIFTLLYGKKPAISDSKRPSSYIDTLPEAVTRHTNYDGFLQPAAA